MAASVNLSRLSRIGVVGSHSKKKMMIWLELLSQQRS